MEIESQRRRFGRDSRLHAWAVAHPVRFGAAGGAIVAVLFSIAGLTSMTGHPLRALVGAGAIGIVFAAVFALMTKATP